MLGAILGDMIGAPYEFDRGNKTKDFPLFNEESEYTDDSVMTVAVAEALMDTVGESDDVIKNALVESMQKWGKKYPYAGYGGMFYGWLMEKDPKPYGSFGNGSAMRVSSAGWLYDTMEETRRIARLTAEVTHNHPEGIKGAEATAAAIFLARTGSSKEAIKEYIVNNFGYDLSRSCDEIRPTYYHVESCMQTVPEAITAFMEGKDFEDVIRTAVSLGGDCDTLTCIAGGIAQAYYTIPQDMIEECRNRLPEDMLEVVDRFMKFACQDSRDMFLDENGRIEEAISRYIVDKTEENKTEVLEAIRAVMHNDGHFLLPVEVKGEDKSNIAPKLISGKDGGFWFVAFTSPKEAAKGEKTEIFSYFIDGTMKNCLNAAKIEGIKGIVINPWGRFFELTNELMEKIFDADGDEEYIVPEEDITAELLEDGSYLKKALEICNRNRTELNIFKLAKILRDSYVWIPCHTVMSDADYENVSKMVMNAKEEGLESLEGMTFTTQDEVRLVPDIMQSDEEFFFPVFTSVEEMGEYREGFSKVEKHFVEAMILARNNEKNVKGIIINAFSQRFFIPRETFDIIADMPSAIEKEKKGEEE